MLFKSNKDKGRAGMALGIAYFGSNGYTVSIPLNDTQWYDFIIEKNGEFQTVQCKATGRNNRRIDLRSTGGTNGGVYDIATDHPVDILFCLNEKGTMYCIPTKDIPEKVKGFTLNTSPNLNNQGFDTYKYIVKM